MTENEALQGSLRFGSEPKPVEIEQVEGLYKMAFKKSAGMGQNGVISSIKKP